MFPNAQTNFYYSQQRGFLLPLALFILVVMGALALTISRTATQTQNSSIQEFTNVQAFYAAESGAQRGMQRLFFSAATPLTRTGINNRCTGWTQSYTFSSAGLQACTALVTCALTTDANNIRSFYTLTSTGSCGASHFRAERVIQVGAQFEQEAL